MGDLIRDHGGPDRDHIETWKEALETGYVHVPAYRPDGRRVIWKVEDLVPPSECVIECEGTAARIRGKCEDSVIFRTKGSVTDVHIIGGSWRNCKHVWLHEPEPDDSPLESPPEDEEIEPPDEELVDDEAEPGKKKRRKGAARWLWERLETKNVWVAFSIAAGGFCTWRKIRTAGTGTHFARLGTDPIKGWINGMLFEDSRLDVTCGPSIVFVDGPGPKRNNTFRHVWWEGKPHEAITGGNGLSQLVLEGCYLENLGSGADIRLKSIGDASIDASPTALFDHCQWAYSQRHDPRGVRVHVEGEASIHCANSVVRLEDDQRLVNRKGICSLSTANLTIVS